MAQPRWLAPWKDDPRSPALYHVINRVVDRRRAFGDEEKEKFKMFMRMVENFSGCQVLSYCVMSNHFHILLEVPPLIRAIRLEGQEKETKGPDGEGCDDCLWAGQEIELAAGLRAKEERAREMTPGLSPANLPEIGVVLDEGEFFERMKALYSDAALAEVQKRLNQAKEAGDWAGVARIFDQFAYRMNDLSQFMKNLLQRFTRWFNRTHDRTGRLWEERFKSVIVEDGFAARTVAAYIDLNPVRAGIVVDPKDYRWSSYAEALAGGKKAQAGLVRAMGAVGAGKNSKNAGAAEAGSEQAMPLEESETDCRKDATAMGARRWAQGGLGKEYRRILLAAGQEVVVEAKVVKKGMPKQQVEAELAALENRKGDLAISKVIRHRIRYFSDGVAIGSKDFVDNFFQGSRKRFGPKRTSGARKPRGALSPLKNKLYSARDLDASP